MKKIIILFFCFYFGSSNASVIYDFQGSGSVTGILTLSDSYVAGSAIAESSDLAGGFFISFERFFSGALDLTITSLDYALVAGTTDPFFLTTAGGDGFLPSLVGISSFADIYIVNRSVSVGLDDYTLAGGIWDTELTSGTQGTWTLRASLVPEPTSLALLGLGLAGFGFSRKKKKA